MRLGDLVQSNIFDPTGSGGYGLVVSQLTGTIASGYWNVHWIDYESEDGMEVHEGGLYHIHEDDMVVVSAVIEKENKE